MSLYFLLVSIATNYAPKLNKERHLSTDFAKNNEGVSKENGLLKMSFAVSKRVKLKEIDKGEI